MGLPPLDVARHLFWMAVAFMIGILLVGVLADRLQRRGIGPMTTLMGLLVLHTAAHAVIVFQVKSLAFPAWLVLSAVGQSAILAFPWFARQVGENLAGRANATINFSMFVAAFGVQYGVGLIIGRFPATTTGYAESAYAWSMGVCLVLQILALIWYLVPNKSQRT
jgi:MFS family permease